MDELGTRMDELESSISQLMDEVGLQDTTNNTTSTSFASSALPPPRLTNIRIACEANDIMRTKEHFIYFFLARRVMTDPTTAPAATKAAVWTMSSFFSPS